MRHVLLLVCILLLLIAAGPEIKKIPTHSKDLADVRAWVEATKGFGQPHFYDLNAQGRRFFVVTNNPNSGQAWTATHSYVFDKDEWKLFNAESFIGAPEVEVQINDAGTGLIYLTWGETKGEALVPGARPITGFDPSVKRVVQELNVSDILKSLGGS